MRKEFLANAIGNIGDGYVEKYARVKKRKKLTAILTSIAAVGAAAAVALFIGLNANRATDYTKLPKIAFEDYHGVALGGNIDRTGLVSKDRPPLWNESMKIETLPVYMSESTEPDHEKMLAFFKNAATALDIPESELEIRDRYDAIKQNEEDNYAIWIPSEELPTFDPIRRMMWYNYSITGTAGNITLELTTDYKLLITYKDGIELPADHNFSEDAPTDEREKALNYLAERFKALTGYEKYKTYPRRAGYMISRAPDASDASEIVNGTLDLTFFQIAENGGSYTLRGIYIHSPAGLDKLGDYPVISVDEAEKILKSDAYEEEKRMPEDAEILQVELTYENLAGYTAVIPYYDFYVRSDDTGSGSDVIACDLYRVSAIPQSFFEGTETGDYGTRANN